VAVSAGILRWAISGAAIVALASAPESRSPIERLKDEHLETVHQARVQWMRDRVVHPQPGIYNDYRAIVHVHDEHAAPAQQLESAKQAGVDVILCADPKAPKPDAWRGFHGRVLFIPGAQDDDELRFPDTEIPLRFLSELSKDTGISSGRFQGMEIYDRRVDAKRHPELLEYLENPRQRRKLASKQKQYRDEVFAAGTGELSDYLARWDAETERHPFTGIATTDSHIGPLNFPDDVSFRFISTHVLAMELSEREIRKSLRDGHVYVAYDWLCDPAGFSFVALNPLGQFEIGDPAPLVRNTRLMARFPVSADIRLIHNGRIVARKEGGDFEFTPSEPGAYRLEAWLKVDGEERPWIYSNPIYLREPRPEDLPTPPTSLDTNVKAIGDVPYTEGKPGDAAKHQLDLYLPADKKNFPVLFFIHGAASRSGDRSQYLALGNRFAKEGIGVVIPSYRLAAADSRAAQIEDVSTALAWSVRYIDKYGGDPTRIFVAGHSAGAQIAALLALDPRYLAGHGLKPDSIRGVIGVSGAYDFKKFPLFGPEEQTAEPPPEHAHAAAPPFLITYAQWDYPFLAREARVLDAALRRHFTPSTLKFLPGENHISEIANVWRDDDALARAIIGFVRSAK
jgi:acetyl esterase/lipase